MTETAGEDELPAPLGALLRQAMALYASDPQQAEFMLGYAVTQAPSAAGLHRALYKFYNRQRRFDLARHHAAAALEVAAREAGLPPDWRTWTAGMLRSADPAPASQALLALKALAFIALRGGDAASARAILGLLARLDPADGAGASVVAALAAGMQEGAP